MMPLQSSGIIVVEKPKTANPTQSVGSTGAANNKATQPQHQQAQKKIYHTKAPTIKPTTPVGKKHFEYYGANDVRQHQHKQQQLQNQQQHNVTSNNSSNSSNSRSQTQLPLMRRATQRNSSNNNSNPIINKCNNSNTITTGGATNTKIHNINVKQHQQALQMNQQQHQLLQHNTIHQQQQQQQQQQHQPQIHQQQSQQLATQLQTGQSKQQQHVQKQHLLSQQMHTTQQQQQQQQQNQQQHTQPQQQVIQVSEEFIESSGATNMMISTTTGEVLNPQIFKIVATDGTTGNMIIDSGSAAAVSGQSKVLLSNLTVLAKSTPTTPNTSNTTAIAVGAGGSLAGQQQQQQQHTISVGSGGGQSQQPQTINYMSAKNLSYLTTAAAAATPISAGVGKTQKFTVTGTYKAGVKQQHQQLNTTTYIQQSQQQQQQTNQATTHGTQQQNQQLYQKLSVPRQVQMVTRVVQQPTAAGTSLSTNTGQQQQQQHAQMLAQPVVGGQKYLSSSATTKSVSITGSSGGNMLKKANSLKITHGNSKVVNNMQIQQQQQGVKTTYITQQQQQQYQMHQPQFQSATASGKVKTSKLLKQYNNVVNNNSSGVNMLQQQQQMGGTFSIGNSGGSHKVQQTTKVTKMTTGKYATHQQLQHVATLPQGTQLHHKTLPQQQQFSTNNNVVQIAAGGAAINSSNNAGGNTIKFVNSSHATVIQQHQTTLPMQQQQQQQAKVTLRQQQQQQQIQLVEGQTTANIINQQQQSMQTGNNSNSSSTQSLLNDDIMIVNGTQMTDELSARILQSMAQKSFGNQQRYQQQQQPKSTAMPPPNTQQTQQQQQQQQQIVLQQHASPTSVLLSPKEYPLYSATQLPTQQQLSAPTSITTQYTNAVHQTPVSASAYLPVSVASSVSGGTVYGPPTPTTGRQTHSAPSSRAHSLERNKSYEASTTITRKSVGEYYKTNSSGVGSAARGGHHHGSHTSLAASSMHSASTSNIPHDTQQQQQHSSAQIIHLQTLKSSLAASTAAVAASNSSYTIATTSNAATAGVAANNTASSGAAATADDDDIIGEEVRPPPLNTLDLRLRILYAVQLDHTYANPMPTHPTGTEASTKSAGAVQMGKTGSANSTNVPSHLQTALSGGNQQQWSLGGIGATVAGGQAGAGSILPMTPTSGQSSYTLHGQQITRMQQDDDAHSAISNGSRVATGDIDPGEETETAPEAEAEDDSVTRCICDLTHDDGYMICCDKCSVWQHVDCMGIDRQNIPDEYQCEVCQPRAVDKARARSLQLMKRKEQTQLLLSAQSAHATGSSGAYMSGAGVANLSSNYQLTEGQRQQGGINTNSFPMSDGTMHGLPNNAALATTKKGKVLKKTAKDTASGKKSKKADKLGAGGIGGKPPRKESGASKKTTKRKTKSGDGLSASASAAEKHAANLRQWIENYELAVTNHYSPELRARLHAITKQPSLLQSILNTENRALKECCNNGLESRATTVPHAGGKILISNMDIGPSCPIFELRGKYMLSPQYKTQNASVNMNSPPPTNYLAATLKAHKTPGPFIFFYQLPDAEAPMQTMNQDGSYPPLPPQPAYLKGPEICVDTRTYGNEARFVRRSCRPNAEIQHLFEKGTIHLFIVATTRIRASTEITIKHEPHDLLAIENKKATASNCIVQPTSTACACGLLKDCLFGPPPTQQSLSAAGGTKSRKSSLSTTLNGGVQLSSSAAAMQLTMGGLPTGAGKKKGPAQNINRNRSTSSSGDSSIGAIAAAATAGMNSPNVALPSAAMNMSASATSNSNVCSNTYKSNGGLNILSAHALVTSASAPSTNGGNMSATSSISSVMHDSGICTSSSSPSVSIPSPTTTLHLHSPTQQPTQQQTQQQQQQQQQQTVPASTTNVQPRGANSGNALITPHSPQQQQQHQQILGALPTPLLLSPPPQMTQTQLQVQQQQHITVNNSHTPLLQEVVSNVDPKPALLTQSLSQAPQQPQEQPVLAQMSHRELIRGPTISDASLAAAAALQSLNTAVTLTSSNAPVVAPNAAPSNTNNNIVIITPEAAAMRPAISTVDTSNAEQQQQHQQQPQQPQHQHQSEYVQQQQTQLLVAPKMQSTHPDIEDGNMPDSQQQQQLQLPQIPAGTVELPPPIHTHTPASAPTLSPNAGSKSPQKHSGPASINTFAPTNSSARSHKTSTSKTPSSRSTSFSEDDHQQQHNVSSGSVNDDVTATAKSSSKEKPKLSREDRKMEAILRAIEKMERNQQRKSQQNKAGGGGSASSSAAKRRNSNSNSPSTPCKRSISELSTSASSGRVSSVNARKKKRKTHKSYSGHSAQARKRRKSRVNSGNESADGAGHSGGLGGDIGVTNVFDGNGCGMTDGNMQSEAESASLLSPAVSLTTTAPNYQMSGASEQHNEVAVDATAPPPTNEDQAAGLLLAFANPNLKMSPTSHLTTHVLSPTAQQQQQYATQYGLEQLKSPQHRTPVGGSGNATSPPATPVSSACLLIEAAVGPLQEHMDGSSPSSEFKYPNKTKTKKVLMSNWLLNQVDADTSGSDSPPPNAPTPPPTNSGVEQAVATITAALPAPLIPTAATLSLDSLVQAATMCDFANKQQSEANVVHPTHYVAPNMEMCSAPMPVDDEPQNLSMAAQKVEEFIQQTERGTSVPYTTQPNLTGVSSSQRHLLHLPLQVSTCSNNSSVKKRWLRQAISEETTTDESMTPTPTAAAAGLQTASPTTATAHLNAVLNVPNGFTTPLKKRRLIISGGVKEEEDIGGNTAPSPAVVDGGNFFESPAVKAEPTAMLATPKDEHDMTTVKVLTTAAGNNAVDVMNVQEISRTLKNEVETSIEEETDEEDYDEEEERDDVDVVGDVGVSELRTSTSTTAAHTVSESMKREVVKKEDSLRGDAEPIEYKGEDLKAEPMSIDQDDDVDILRSPSPGHQQMLAAEDNLVKIEPEDTSGGDVKIDVEREESLAGDRFEEMVLMHVKKEEALVEGAQQLSAVVAAEETKPSLQEDEKNIKSSLPEPNDNAMDQKPYEQLPSMFEENEKHKKEESEVPNFENITKTEPHNAMDVETSSAHLSSAVANSDDESMMTIPPKPSPLKLLTLDGSRSTCIPTSDEPLKKRPKLDSSLAATTSSQSEVPQTQTSLLKPLSARMLDMAKPSVVNSASGGNNNNSKNEIASTQANTLPTKSLLKSAAAKKPTVQHSVVASPPSNCMTFLAAAAAAAIERKPPPPPPPPPASVATISPTKSDVPASTTATTPVVEGINNNNNNNNTPAAPFVPNTTALEATTNAGVGSTALAPRKQNATTNNNNSNERKIPLTDDDIQARLHSFHKENILILQSRNNKKSKTNATAATTTVGAGSANELVKNVKLSENKSSHHSHHHSHDAVKSSSGSKHNSTSKSLSNSSSGSSGKKLHKKDRSGKEHSSSSSRSSSSHSGKLSASSSSSRKSSSSHKKDHASGKTSSGNTTPVLTTKQQTHICNSSNTSAGSDSKERLDDRRDIDKNRGGDKERHHNRHRTTSSSSSSNANNTPATPAAIPATPPTAPTAPPTTFKKRQLNFEQELTKDLPLVNAATLNINRHRKDSGSRDSRDDLLSSSCSSNSNSSLVAARKRRESSSSSSGGSRNRHNSTSSSSGIATLEQQKDVAAVPVAVPVTHKPAATEHNGILTNAHVTALPPPTYVREHVAIPHFNNVVVSGPPPPMMAAYFSGIGAVPGGSVDPSMGTPIATYVPTPALPPSAGIAQPSPTHNHSLLKNLPMQPVLSHLAAAVHGPVPATLPASSGGVNVSVLTPPPPPQTSATVVPPAAHSPGASSNSTTASTYNSIYGKLRDTSPVIAAPTSGVSVAPPTPLNPVVGAQAQTAGTSANLSLSEYLDTKVKSYSTTLGSYVSQTHAFVAGGGAGNATSLLQSVGKTSNNNSNNTAPSVSSSSVGVDTVSAVSAVLESPVVSKLPAPLKLPLTRTASHDPRLNPQLNAPEPPPAPKRKLSINEYRKRMQLSSDSATPSTPEPPTVSSTPTTTPSGAGNMSSNSLNNSFVQAYNSIVNASPEEMARQLSSSPSSSLALNKYTLNSPEHKRRHSGSEKEQQQKGHGANYDDAVTGLLNSSTGSSSLSDISLTNHEDEGRKGQFSAAPTLLEKQQESLCERLKLLRNKNKSVTTLSSAASEFANLKKDCDRYVNRTNSISSTDNLDNCLEEISSSSSSSSASSRTSSREPSPERNVVSNNLSSVCKRATSATSSTNHKWLHDTDAIKSSSGASKTGTPTRDDVSVTRCGSGSESTT